MWNRTESDKVATPSPLQRSTTTPAAAPAPVATRVEIPRASALIGRSITVRGEIISDEDLTIDGRVEGTIAIGDHSLTIGAGASVSADLKAHTVTISGRVKGNVTAKDKIDISETGSVEGDLSAPIIAIREGAELRGRIDTTTAQAWTERKRETKEKEKEKEGVGDTTSLAIAV